VTARARVKSSFLQKLAGQGVRVVVIGAGYVGLPLAVEFARAGLRVTAYDRSSGKVDMLQAGRSYVEDVRDDDLAPHLRSGIFAATTDPACIRDADAVVICVPTPLSKTKTPDLSAIMAALHDIVSFQHPGMLVILESTTYPGTTREVVVPALTQGYVLGEQVFVAFSPERVDPGNPVYHTRNTPKVLGGVTSDCLEVASALYSRVIETLVPVSSVDVAEMVKLLENTFRAVNIGLVNELARLSGALHLDVTEVVEAAATKPFGFMPFYPGPGLGGHCIPVDPHYLSWRLRTLNHESRFIELADQINSSMPSYVVRRAMEVLNERCKALRGACVLVVGVAYKPNVGDVRESPALEVLEQLAAAGGSVEYIDPHVPEITRRDGEVLRALPLDTPLLGFDLAVIATHHAAFDYGRIAREVQDVLDTRGVMRKLGQGRIPANVHIM